ncbi:Mur ligase family protein [Haloactinomyces albus]|uniref:Lipid II isoglutaminyl synthase (glutamine-hydrolyzing) subunit MurT n=1 Tax=Haloactinomyces albus TaxID=1352928 RepID=A0AAE3ZB17_9ACTN|nr:MurT ligase domain-containing protein [Haloactinomyces albus]MDR7299932.1 UDP-N-acetylmuramyl tripeptide synthase [Haloactinomyces albus]
MRQTQAQSRDNDTRSNGDAVSAHGPATQQRWRVVAPTPKALSAALRPRGLRTVLAFTAGRTAATLSRRLGMGSGAIIGGRVAMTVQPRALPHLVRGTRVVMITGTNGKTTTTQMVAEALRASGETVSNATGANMLDGHVAALMMRPQASYAALEVDELHLAQVTGQFEPAVIVLLNLTRDQLDRVGEIRTVEHSIRRALRQAPGAHVVANSDDPNVVSAAADHPNVTWISGGGRWKDDALNCPRCGAFLENVDHDWRCSCGLSRPAADWTVDASGLTGPDGAHHELSLRLPGQVNRTNAAFALAAARELGGGIEAVLARIGSIDQAHGRYGTVVLAGRTVRLLLAKNPASWLEMLDLVSTHRRPLILVVNSQEADGYDVSWLWDIAFESLEDRGVTVAGERALDLAVRLRYAGVRCEVASSVPAALAAMSEDTPDVIANYTAFRDLFAKGTKP